MDYNQALQVIENAVYTQRRKPLSQPEKIVLEAAWNDCTLEKASEFTDYTYYYLNGTVAPGLWKLLTATLGEGKKKVKKKGFRAFMEQLPADQQLMLTVPPPQSVKTRSRLSPGQSAEVIGGQPPDISGFQGRGPEQAMLKQLINENYCVALIGAPGIGKTALAAKIVQEFSSSTLTGFKTIIWKSIHYAPSLENFVTELVRLLIRTHKMKVELPETTEARISLLLEYLDSHQTLIVLDAAEALLQGNRSIGLDSYGKYADYGVFLRRLVEEQHQSCFLLTSREPFNDIWQMQEVGQAARLLRLEGLGRDAMPILRDKELADEERWGELIRLYRGNPLALRMVANGIQDFFGGSVATYLQHQTMLMVDLFQDSLDQQFGQQGRLTSLERGLMIYLADALSQGAESISFHQLLDDLKARDLAATTSRVMAAIEALEGRSLVEKSKSQTGEVYLSLQPVIHKYILSRRLELARDTMQAAQSA